MTPIRRTATELDKLHDSGKDITPYLDLKKATRPGRNVQRVNVDFPVDLLRAIDLEARRIGVTRQAFIKLRLSDTLPAWRGSDSRPTAQTRQPEPSTKSRIRG